MFSRVLVGVDGGPGGRDAIALAKQLTQTGHQLMLAHVCRDDGLLGSAAALLLPAERHESLRLLARERNAASVAAKLATGAAPSVGRGLHELGRRHDADLLVLGSSHRGPLGRVFLGDDALNTLNGAPCAVAIAPRNHRVPRRLADIGIGYDGSPESLQALSAGRELARGCGARIHALSVVSLESIPLGEPTPLGWPKSVGGLVKDARELFREMEDVDGEATYGEPSEELAKFAAKLDLLIVGSRGYGTVGRLFNGSTSNYLARHAACPLLVLPPRAVTDDRPLDAPWATTATSMGRPAVARTPLTSSRAARSSSPESGIR